LAKSDVFKVRGEIPKPKLMTLPAMAKFRDMKTFQKFAAVHATIHNHFNRDRHLNRRDIFKPNRSAALAE
jgi:hypothetical protein